MDFNSKAIDLDKKTNSLQYYLERIPGFSFLRSHFNRFCRACAFFKIGYNNFDWDCGYVHQLMLFKLKRLRKGLHEGYAIHEEKHIKALDLCIKLLDLNINGPNDKFMRLHDEKWGPLDWKFEKIEGTENEPGGPHSRSIFSRSNAITEEQKEQERKEMIIAYNIDERRQERFLQTAYKILMKYHRYFWD